MQNGQGSLRLPRLIGNGMVLQRNAGVKIWGWAAENGKVSVSFCGGKYDAYANGEGKWMVEIPTGDAGGPFAMTVETADGSDKITLENILLGDVWLCSGQSNMDMRMFALQSVYPDEIAQADNDRIRQFAVPVKFDFNGECEDVAGGDWESADSRSIRRFSAVGYFFASKLYEKLGVPIGIINASLGGAPAEAFISEDAIAPFRNEYAKLQKLKDEGYIQRIVAEEREAGKEWHRRLDAVDAGLGSDTEKPFYDPQYDASGWTSVNVPSYWNEIGLGHMNGAVWYRKEIDLPHPADGEEATLCLGNVIDEDTVYINGTRIGGFPSQYVPRRYQIPDGVLREGRNIIVVRVVSGSDNSDGGFYAGKKYFLRIGDRTIDVSGEWKYKIGAKCEPMPPASNIMWGPAGLYNGMLAPVIPYTIKGAAWYQGETNAQWPATYEELLKTLIANWRSKWKQGDFPFVIVQLPNFREIYRPSAGNWPAIREAQRRALSMPNTGMAVTIDIGDPYDVHSLNKKDVGIRLALAVLKTAYGDDSEAASGPLFREAKRDGNRMLVYFDEIGGGLVAKGGGRLNRFEIAAEDGKFVPAEAEIEGDCVAVRSGLVAAPSYVRYAWDDNPEGANLYNRKGLPASPFTTEQQYVKKNAG